MSVEVVCGVNWGDEGKGRMVDYLAERADYVVRYQGGNNAGHTVVNSFGNFALHLVPSGVFYDHVTNVLGPGTSVDLEGLVKEIDDLTSRGVGCEGVLISDRATIQFPFHRAQDVWEEDRLGHSAFGSTKNGIAPSYGDRHMKRGIRVGDLLFPDHLEKALRELVVLKNLIATGVYGKPNAFDFDECLEWTRTFGSRLLPRICDTTQLLREAVDRGKSILFESQLGALRDLNFGIYPFTTSTSCLSSFAPIGGGLFGVRPNRVLGVMKAFSTCVGSGPFVAAMDEDEANSLRELALEYGATTGRPRTIGHFDAVASRFGVEVQEATQLALTKLDSLSGREKLKICVEYDFRGEKIRRFPLTPVLEEARPVYIECSGWEEDVASCRRFEELPKAAREYVTKIERLVGCPVRYVSVGPERQQLIDREA
jgi:adenylosuccinate synthase